MSILNICGFKEHKKAAWSAENTGTWPVTMMPAAFNPVTFRKRAPSTDPVVAKLQQEPQMAWSFTGVTAPVGEKLKTRMSCQANASLEKHLKIVYTHRKASSRVTQVLAPLRTSVRGRGGLCLASSLVSYPSWWPARTWCDPTESSEPE